MRGIANAGKHLNLSNVRPIQHAPSNAANTQIVAAGYDTTAYDTQAYDNERHVELEGANRPFLDILETVYQMWENLRNAHGW
jgi:hypothetical protein